MAYRICVALTDARAAARLHRVAERLFMLPQQVVDLRLAWDPPWLIQVERLEQAQRLCELLSRATRITLTVTEARGASEPCDLAIELLEEHDVSASHRELRQMLLENTEGVQRITEIVRSMRNLARRDSDGDDMPINEAVHRAGGPAALGAVQHGPCAGAAEPAAPRLEITSHRCRRC